MTTNGLTAEQKSLLRGGIAQVLKCALGDGWRSTCVLHMAHKDGYTGQFVFMDPVPVDDDAEYMPGLFGAIRGAAYALCQVIVDVDGRYECEGKVLSGPEVVERLLAQAHAEVDEGARDGEKVIGAEIYKYTPSDPNPGKGKR